MRSPQQSPRYLLQRMKVPPLKFKQIPTMRVGSKSPVRQYSPIRQYSAGRQRLPVNPRLYPTLIQPRNKPLLSPRKNLLLSPSTSRIHSPRNTGIFSPRNKQQFQGRKALHPLIGSNRTLRTSPSAQFLKRSKRIPLYQQVRRKVLLPSKSVRKVYIPKFDQLGVQLSPRNYNKSVGITPRNLQKKDLNLKTQPDQPKLASNANPLENQTSSLIKQNMLITKSLMQFENDYDNLSKEFTNKEDNQNKEQKLELKNQLLQTLIKQLTGHLEQPNSTEISDRQLKSGKQSTYAYGNNFEKQIRNQSKSFIGSQPQIIIPLIQELSQIRANMLQTKTALNSSKENCTQLEAQIKSLKEQNSSLKKINENQSVLLSQFSNENVSLANDFELVDKRIQQLELKLNDQIQENSRIRSENLDLIQQQSKQGQLTEDYKEEYTQLQNQLGSQGTDLQTLQNSLKPLENECEELTKVNVALEKRCSELESMGSLSSENQKKELFKTNNKITELETLLQEAQEVIIQKEEIIMKQEENIKHLEHDNEEMLAIMSSQQSKGKGGNGDHLANEDDLNTQRIKELQQKVDEYGWRNQELLTHVSDLQSQLNQASDIALNFKQVEAKALQLEQINNDSQMQIQTLNEIIKQQQERISNAESEQIITEDEKEQINSFQMEINRLNLQIKSTSEQLEHVNNESNLQNKTFQSQLESQIKELTQENQQIKEETKNLQLKVSEYQADHDKYNSLEQDYLKTTDQNNQLQFKVKNLEKQLQQFKEEYQKASQLMITTKQLEEEKSNLLDLFNEQQRSNKLFQEDNNQLDEQSYGVKSFTIQSGKTKSKQIKKKCETCLKLQSHMKYFSTFNNQLVKQLKLLDKQKKASEIELLQYKKLAAENNRLNNVITSQQQMVSNLQKAQNENVLLSNSLINHKDSLNNLRLSQQLLTLEKEKEKLIECSFQTSQTPKPKSLFVNSHYQTTINNYSPRNTSVYQQPVFFKNFYPLIVSQNQQSFRTNTFPDINNISKIKVQQVVTQKQENQKPDSQQNEQQLTNIQTRISPNIYQIPIIETDRNDLQSDLQSLEFKEDQIINQNID